MLVRWLASLETAFCPSCFAHAGLYDYSAQGYEQAMAAESSRLCLPEPGTVVQHL